jgi:carbamoyl-phosphate synthase large subunit
MKIIFISGGIWQKPFVEYLKNKGNFVAVVNPVVTETTLISDQHIKTDVHDLEEINKHIKALNPSFITTDQSDISTLIVAKLSEKWNLPGNNSDVMDKLTNKFSIYKHGKQIGIPVPNTKLVQKTQDILSFAEIYGFPIIIKPIDATNSRGFNKIDTANEVTNEILQSSLNFSKLKQVIVQNYISGSMIVMDGICSGGKHKTITHAKKNNYFKPGINTDVQYPSDLPNIFLQKLIAVNDSYVESTNMQFGLTHSEYIIDLEKNIFHLIEIGGRGGGAGITDKIVPWVSGIQPYDILYSSLLNQIIDVKKLKPLKRPALLKYYRKEDLVNCTPRKIEQIKKIPGVADFQFDFISKQYVQNTNDTRHSMSIVLSESKHGIRHIIKEIKAIIKSNE